MESAGKLGHQIRSWVPLGITRQKDVLKQVSLSDSMVEAGLEVAVHQRRTLTPCIGRDQTPSKPSRRSYQLDPPHRALGRSGGRASRRSCPRGTPLVLNRGRGQLLQAAQTAPRFSPFLLVIRWLILLIFGIFEGLYLCFVASSDLFYSCILVKHVPLCCTGPWLPVHA